MRRIKFEYPPGSPTNTLELTWGIDLKAPTWRIKAGSLLGRAWDGTIYAPVKRVAVREIPLTINLMTESERDDLIDFINEVTLGRYRVFRYTDQDDVEHDVRFLDEVFDFGDGTFPYSLSVTLQEE